MVVYNTLFDLTATQDSLNRRKCGENTDPSSKYLLSTTGVTSERRGYSTGRAVDGGDFDKENYVIRSCLGLLNPSTSILNINILGSVVIKIRLAPPICLMLGTDADDVIGGVLGDTDANETGVEVTTVISGTELATTTSNYTLSGVKFTIGRYDLPSEFYMTEASRLTSGAVFKLWLMH